MRGSGLFCEPGQWEMNKADRLAVPCVGDVKIAVAALDRGGVGVFPGLIFEGVEYFEVLAILADSEVQGSASRSDVIEDQHHAAILEGYCINARVGIGDID